MWLTTALTASTLSFGMAPVYKADSSTMAARLSESSLTFLTALHTRCFPLSPTTQRITSFWLAGMTGEDRTPFMRSACALRMELYWAEIFKLLRSAVPGARRLLGVQQAMSI